MPTPRPPELNVRVLDVLHWCGPMPPSAVARALGVEQEAVRRCLTRMYRRGSVRFAGLTGAPRLRGARAPEAFWEAVPPTGE